MFLPPRRSCPRARPPGCFLCSAPFGKGSGEGGWQQDTGRLLGPLLTMDRPLLQPRLCPAVQPLEQFFLPGRRPPPPAPDLGADLQQRPELASARSLPGTPVVQGSCAWQKIGVCSLWETPPQISALMNCRLGVLRGSWNALPERTATCCGARSAQATSAFLPPPPLPGLAKLEPKLRPANLEDQCGQRHLPPLWNLLARRATVSTCEDKGSGCVNRP